MNAVIPDAVRCDEDGAIDRYSTAAAARGGLWLVPLTDGSFGMAYGRRLSTVLRAPLPVDESEREELVAITERAAARVVSQVHTESPEKVWSAVASLSGQQLVALVIALAAAVDGES